MGNILTIRFVPCDAALNATYKVRYKRGSIDTVPEYTLYPVVFTGTPAILQFPLDQPTETYEGFLDTFCNGNAGPSVPWSVIPGEITPPEITWEGADPFCITT